MAEVQISVFISYSHRDKEFVRVVAEELQSRGVHAWLDAWDLLAGDSPITEISKAVAQTDFVAAFVSEASNGSKWCRKEVSLAVSGELSDRRTAVLPVRLAGAEMPPEFRDKLYVDAAGKSAGEVAEVLVTDMRRHLKPRRVIPHAREMTRQAKEALPESEGPIRMVGVDATGITSPRLDGTAGSALYRVPILLSRTPSHEWAQLMTRNWDFPPRFTTMHRPGIGRVDGRSFVLDGTTLEEVEKYHLETLELAIGRTNQEWDEATRRAQDRVDVEAKAQRAQQEQRRATLERLEVRLKGDPSV